MPNDNGIPKTFEEQIQELKNTPIIITRIASEDIADVFIKEKYKKTYSKNYHLHTVPKIQSKKQSKRKLSPRKK
ncbi:TPA: hypothetical protein DEP21_02125 [Patescibacteria group bacterium]|nr:hypothetical protein [Candidatus Gracilibacteria bacterium]